MKAAFIVSRAIKGTKIGKEISSALTDYQLPVLETCINQRVIYPTSAAMGSSVLDEEPNGEATKEINNLTNEVLSI